MSKRRARHSIPGPNAPQRVFQPVSPDSPGSNLGAADANWAISGEKVGKQWGTNRHRFRPHRSDPSSRGAQGFAHRRQVLRTRHSAQTSRGRHSRVRTDLWQPAAFLSRGLRPSSNEKRCPFHVRCPFLQVLRFGRKPLQRKHLRDFAGRVGFALLTYLTLRRAKPRNA